jgi:hypothetical protein
MGTLARRGLTPILVLLVVAPPRVCACDHEDEPLPIECLADPATDDDRHDHDDPDCPCLKPAQLKPTTLAAAVSSPSPAAVWFTLSLSDDGRPGQSPALVAGRSGEPPPLYLTLCTLRF